MNAIKLAIAGVALAGVFGAASAEARGRDDVQFSITIGNAVPAVVVGRPAPVYGAPVYAAPVYVRSHERGYVAPRHHRGHRHVQRPTRWDRDGDGIPNRYDRHDARKHGRR